MTKYIMKGFGIVLIKILLFRELHRWQHMTYTIKVCKFHS